MIELERAMEDVEGTGTCEFCGRELTFTYGDARRGRVIKCPHCGEDIRLVISNPGEVKKAQREIDGAIDGLRETIKKTNRRM